MADYYNPTSSFFQGFSEGLFGSLKKNREKAQSEADQEKESALKLLSSMIDKVDPESQPTLLRHIGDVMGLKGQQKSFWAQLTGADLQSDRQAVRSRLNEILGSLAGPDEMAQLKPHKEVQGFGTGAYGPVPFGKVTEDRSKGRIGLRDPRKEAIDKLQAQYQLKYEADQSKLYEKEDLLRQRMYETEAERQRNRLEVQERGALNKAEFEIKRDAMVAYHQNPSKPLSDYMAEGAARVAARDGLNLEKLKGQIGLIQASTEAKQAEALALAESGGRKPMTEGQAVARDQAQQTKAQATFDAYGKARSAAVQKGQQLQAIHDQISATAKARGLTYDAARGLIQRKDGSVDDTAQFMFGDSLKKAQQLTAEKAAAMEEMLRQRSTLGSSYSDYYDIGGTEWDVRPKAEFGGVAPVGAPRTRSQGPSTSKPGQRVAPPPQDKRIPDVGEVSNWTTSTVREVGEVIQVSGNIKFKVLQRLGQNGMDITYKVRRIQ